MARTSAPTHLIYDMDGLLLDTESLYTQAYRILTARYGKEYDLSLKMRCMGRKAGDSARIIIHALGIPVTPERWLAERKPLLDALFTTAGALPGARRLTEHMRRAHVPQAVATSSDRYNLNLKTARHREWFDIFDLIVSGDDPAIQAGKPSPDIFLIAAQRLGALPRNCLVFEDAPIGVAAARAAGMNVIAVPDAAMDRACYQEADQVLASLEEFDPAEWGLPAFRA